jgi:hypothetical protein
MLRNHIRMSSSFLDKLLDELARRGLLPRPLPAPAPVRIRDRRRGRGRRF